jgi:type I restriction-modification system DNA methylase subunit
MSALGTLRTAIEQIGYSTIENNYVFSDVFDVFGVDRKATLAAFTHYPPSYRNAAFAAVEANGRDAADVAIQYRALGAPLLFVIEGEQVSIWTIHHQARPSLYQNVRLDQIGELFAAKSDEWRPRRIQNAKSFSLLSRSYQLDFVDIGLLPAIEGELHGKLDRLLNETLSETVRLRVIRPGETVSEQLTFRTVFRLLAAKFLQDREHELAQTWNPQDIDSVLKRIAGYYQLPVLPGEARSFKGTVFDSAWAKLRQGISFRNVSSDDLAFVYENTLVTDETRQLFGVHSTPRPVAEYVLSRLQLPPDRIESASVYEPFAGAGVFMVAALRRLTDLLPVEMTAQERHNFLVKRIRGDEIEPFAREVAMLSLILADYPNENGWAVSVTDLFQDELIRNRANGARIVLCNPPFEKFTPEERGRYPEALKRSPRKPIAVLQAILDARPEMLGFVMPEAFIEGDHYRNAREYIEKQYKGIEVVALPDRVFKASGIRSSLLIAQDLRNQDDDITILKSSFVRVRDRDQFLKSGTVSESRSKIRLFDKPTGKLWISELDDLWDALAELPRLDAVANVHRGLEWQEDQSDAVRDEPRQGSRAGIHSGNAVHVFHLDKPRFLDCRPSRLRGGAINLPWGSPKLLANAARISRGPWCFAAAVDRRKLVASQQLLGIWPEENCPFSLNALCAILNSPLAVAYIASHSPPDRIRVKNGVESVPVPVRLPESTEDLIQQYIRILSDRAKLFTRWEQQATEVLWQIDAAILESYNLSPRLERRLLEYFRGETRPTFHEWHDWLPRDFKPFIPLHEYFSPRHQKLRTSWITEVFAPLPPNEADALLDYMD